MGVSVAYQSQARRYLHPAFGGVHPSPRPLSVLSSLVCHSISRHIYLICSPLNCVTTGSCSVLNSVRDLYLVFISVYLHVLPSSHVHTRLEDWMCFLPLSPSSVTMAMDPLLSCWRLSSTQRRLGTAEQE